MVTRIRAISHHLFHIILFQIRTYSGEKSFWSSFCSTLKSFAKNIAIKCSIRKVNRHPEITMVTPIKAYANEDQNGNNAPERYQYNESDDQDMKSEHFQKYLKIWKIFNFLLYLVGIEIRKKTTLSLRLILTSFAIWFGHSLVVYTIYLVWPDIEQLLEVICILGLGIPV